MKLITEADERPDNFTGIVEYNGDKYWYKNGKCHREDGPAVEYTNGDKLWYKNDQLHREDGPALEYVNGNKYWFKNGKLHREDGPAIDYANGYKAWYFNGKQYYEQDFNKKMKKNKIFQLININDGNDAFWVEGKTVEEAALNALEKLGWSVGRGKSGKLGKDGEPEV